MKTNNNKDSFSKPKEENQNSINKTIEIKNHELEKEKKNNKKLIIGLICCFALLIGATTTAIVLGVRKTETQTEEYIDQRVPELVNTTYYELTEITRNTNGISFKIVAKEGSEEANGATITIGDQKLNNDEFIFTKEKVTILNSTLKKYVGHIKVDPLFHDDTKVYFNYHELQVSSDDAVAFSIPYVTSGNGKVKWSTTDTHFLNVDESTGLITLNTEELTGVTKIEVNVIATAAGNSQTCKIVIVPAVNNYLNFTHVVYENVDAYSVSIKEEATEEIEGTLEIPAYYEGKQVVSIAAHGFSKCTKIENIVLPETIYNIGGMAFNGCTSLKSINIPKTTFSFGSNVFTETATDLETKFESKAVWKYTDSESKTGTLDPTTKTSAEMAAAIKSLDDKVATFEKQGIADEENNLMYYYTTEISASVAPINDDVEGEINIPSYVKADGNIYIIDSIVYNFTTKKSAFSTCQKITKISIPSTLTTINVNSFSTCSALEEINVDGSNPVYSSLEGVLYTKNLERLIAYPNSKSTTKFVVPNATREIAPYALANTKYLEEFTYGDNSKLENIYSFSFAQSVSIKNVKLPSSLKYLDYYVFYNCTKLESLEFEDTSGWSYIEYSYIGTPSLTDPSQNAKNAISYSYQLCWDGIKK